MNPYDGIHSVNINLYTRLTPEIAGAIKFILDQIPDMKQALDTRLGPQPDPRNSLTFPPRPVM